MSFSIPYLNWRNISFVLGTYKSTLWYSIVLYGMIPFKTAKICLNHNMPRHVIKTIQTTYCVGLYVSMLYNVYVYGDASIHREHSFFFSIQISLCQRHMTFYLCLYITCTLNCILLLLRFGYFHRLILFRYLSHGR